MTDKQSELLRKAKAYLAQGKPFPIWSDYTHTFGFSESAARRAFGSLPNFRAACDAENPELPAAGKERKDEIAALKSKLREAESNAADAAKLRELIGTLDSVQHDVPRWTQPPAKTKGLTGIPFLFLSDIHFDERVHPSQIGGVNEYSREIATKRLEYTFSQAVNLLKNFLTAPKYDGFVLALGGDLLSGNIHEELAESNEATINESIIALSDILIAGISLLADSFGRVFVPSVVGNHGRQHKKPRMKHRVFHNYEWLVYQILARHFAKDKRVSFLIPEGADAEFTVYGKRFLLTHGDQFSGGNGIGGIMVPIQRGLAKKQMRQAAIDRHFDVALMGHWHQLVMLENLIINGTTKGYDEYAYINNFAFEPPRQACFVVHPDHGVTFRLPIQCDGYEQEKNEAKPLEIWA